MSLHPKPALAALAVQNLVLVLISCSYCHLALRAARMLVMIPYDDELELGMQQLAVPWGVRLVAVQHVEISCAMMGQGSP